MLRKTILCALISLSASVLCAAPSLVATTSVEPVAFVMRSLAADHWQVTAMSPKGADPHEFALRPAEASDFHASKIYLAVGMEADIQMIPRAPKTMDVVRVLPELAESDPHLWLDPEGLAAIAMASRDAFTRADPEHAADYSAAFEAFSARLAASSLRAGEILRPFAGRAFVVHHAAFARFAQTFGLRQVALEENEKEPSAARIAEIAAQIRDEKIAVIYAQPGHNPAPVEAIAHATGAAVRELDALPSDPVEALEVRAKILAEGFAANNADVR